MPPPSTGLDPGASTARERPGKAAAKDGVGIVEPTRLDPALAAAKTIPVTTPSALPPGTRVGQYELIRPLGRGGMGQVYLARDVTLGRRVAMKFMLDAETEFAERLTGEARATARCQHENIVVIHEVGEYRGYPFLVLEYLEGEGLDAILGKATLSVDRAVELIVPVVRALRHAHVQGLVHRDLKPENIFLTEGGVVKVLDFGIAKAFEGEAPRTERVRDGSEPAPATITEAGMIVGTLPFMAPEQLLGAAVDGRTDLWAVGILLYIMLSGRHPLAALDRQQLRDSTKDLEQVMPSLSEAGLELPPALCAIVDRCLRKRSEARYAGAAELLAALEPLLPDRRARPISDGVCPYAGLSSFAESDHDRFFGRAGDIRRTIARLHDRPLLGVFGPSGAGKSSFIRAGLAPALKGGREAWEILALRPGRDALMGLAELARGLDDTVAADGADPLGAIAAQLRVQPGYLGALLRERARRSRRRILLVVDQLEELFTLVSATEDRAAFLACLGAIADDAASPLRVIVSIRSDFIDRLGDTPDFMGQLLEGLIFLSPLDRPALKEALTRPAAMAGYSFESEDLIEEMADELELAPGALPLLQFAATKLWDGRDREARLLTTASYRAMGGVAGAIAAHADQVVAELAPALRRDLRAIFRRLVTPERTRAIVDVRELLEVASSPDSGQVLIDQLVRARLLVVSTQDRGSAAEIVHESLITRWPLLSRWIEEEAELLALQAELRQAAKQWDEHGRSPGLLWRDQALTEARRLRAHFAERELPARERAFLDAAIELDQRSRRTRRLALVGAFGLLTLVAAGAITALVYIRAAEGEARRHAERARDEAENALAAQRHAKAEETQRRAAERAAESASEKVEEKDKDLRQTNLRLAAAVEDQRRVATRAKDAQHEAETEAERAHRAEEVVKVKQRELEVLLKEKVERVRTLERRLSEISVQLK